jgi:energy-coupling factor transporter ATP-binding protein EcfA2
MSREFNMDIERHNHRQIEQLNQRGGRMLSIVDLIQAGTISVEMAAYAMRAMAEGASLLTAARPGGAGKTTLMAALLGLLPPDVPLVTVDSSRIIHDGLQRSAAEPACYLAHEIGSGDWFGYIWGRDVGNFFSLIEDQRRIASCLHADTLEELTGILCSLPLRVARETLGRVGLILFMYVAPAPGGYRRRVSSFWEADGQGGHRLVFRWNVKADTYEPTTELHDPKGLDRYRDFLRGLLDAGEVTIEAARRKALEFCRDGQ